MFLQAEKAELPRILDSYKKDLRNCLYGYIDIKKYGIEDPNLNLYYSEKDGALNAVATEYYGGIQLYSFENRGDLESILSFLREKTREDCRSRGLAGKTVGKLCRVLLAEGKTPHLFYYRENAGRLYRKLGFDAGTGWGRLLRREGEAGA